MCVCVCKQTLYNFKLIQTELNEQWVSELMLQDDALMNGFYLNQKRTFVFAKTNQI